MITEDKRHQYRLNKLIMNIIAIYTTALLKLAVQQFTNMVMGLGIKHHLEAPNVELYTPKYADK